MTISIAEFRRVVFFTGAGMSAESGVPTYRGAGGIWKRYDYRRYACQEAFDEDPDAVWEFHNKRRELVGACAPHSGHDIIARLEDELEEVSVITQNIDGMHQRAGSRRVMELHGSLWRVRCGSCGVVEKTPYEPLEHTYCSCGTRWRPDIVWFGDGLSRELLIEAVRTIKSCDLFVSIGTSAVVYPAAQLPLVAKLVGAKMVEINPEATDASNSYDVHLRGAASAMLASIA